MAEETEQEALAPLWQSAIAEYEKDTKRQVTAGSLATLRQIRSVEELLTHIETSGQEFRDFRNKRSRLWQTLSSFVSPLTAVLKIAITPSSVSDAFGVPASAAIGACLYLVRSCENVSNAYDWIEQVFTELQEFSERLDVYAQSHIGAVLQKKIVAILAFVLRVIGRSESLIRDHRFRQYLRVTFLGKDEKTKKLVEDLNKLFGSEQRFVLAVTYATAQRIEEKLDDKVAQIEQNVKQVQNSLKENQERETSAQIDDRIRRVLCNTSAAEDVEETFFRNRRSLLEGTGAWLRDEALFKSWIDRQATILWIFGGPGSGKSYLSTWLIQQLLYDTLEQQKEDRSIAYFFVKENNEELRDANNILKVVAWQLTAQDPHFKRHAAEITKQRALTITTEDTWENIFLGYYGRAELNPRFASIVIDGLDEATSRTRRTLLGLMKELVSVSRSPRRPAIQFAVVGRTSLRNDVDITRQEKIYYIEISKHKNKEDIDSYIRKRLEEVEVLQEMRKMKHGLKRANKTGAAIKTRILEGADGVFLWAKLLIDTILRKDLAQIESILKVPPADLDNMIWSVFDRMAKDEELDHELLRKMLLFCGYARRPLKYGELDLFLSLPSRRPNLLLWKQTRGKLSSVFECKYPEGYDPDEDEIGNVHDDEDGKRPHEEAVDVKDEGGETLNADSDPDAGEFDFSGEVDDDDDDDSEDDLFSLTVDHGLQSNYSGFERESTDKTIRHLSDGQLKTEITFCHARIKDYLVREGSPLWRQKPACAIIPDSGRVQAQMTITCLEVLRLELSLKTESKYLVLYPLRYLTAHLEGVDRACINDTDFCRIVEGMHWLFGTERGAECFIQANQDYDEYHSSKEEFFQTLVATERHLRVVQHWFREAKERSPTNLRLDTAETLWVQSAAEHFGTLLKPLMMAASKLWLKKPSYASDDYGNKREDVCWMLHGWLSLAEIGSVPEELLGFVLSRDWSDFSTLSPERLETLANWAGFEHDTHWHTCLGWILMAGRFYAEAIAHYNEAIVQDPQAWVAMEGTARSYGEQEQYQLAIDWQTKAIKAIPEPISWIGSFLHTGIVTWSLKLGNPDLASESARIAFATNTWNTDAQLKYLEMLDKQGKRDEIMSTIQWMNENEINDMGYSLLIRLFISEIDVYGEIGKACRVDRQSAWVLDVMDAALEKVDKDDRERIKVWLPLQMAKFRYTWYDDREDEAIELAEKFLERLGRQTSAFQEGFTQDRSEITNKLAQLYFDKAVASFNTAHGTSSEANVFADKLKSLAVSITTSFADDYDGFDFFRKDYPSLLWGRWLRDYRKADEKTWRKCFKVRLLEEMNSLDDDDPTNDTAGMTSLAISLFHAGYRRDAAAILAILFKPLEDAEAKKSKAKKEAEGQGNNPEQGERKQADHSQPGSGSSSSDLHREQWAKAEPDDADQSRNEGISDQLPRKHENDSGPESPKGRRSLSLNITEKGWEFYCDNCMRHTTEVKEMYFCEICQDVAWCEDCVVLAKDRSLKPGLNEHKCNPNHELYRVWPIPNEAKGLAAEYLGGGIELRREWLERLRGDWLRAGI